MATATAAEAATDFLTATGFRSRPPSKRATERRRLSRFTETISVSIPFVCRNRQDGRFTQVKRSAKGSLSAQLSRSRRSVRQRPRPPPATSRRSFSPFWHALPPSLSSHPALINASHYYRVGVRPGFKFPSHKANLTRCAVLWRVIG